MRIGILGAGLTGCSLARLLADRGHGVLLLEKEQRIGGLCVSDCCSSGLLYEPYGARTFHTANDRVRELALRFAVFNGYRHRKGVEIEGHLLPFPLTRAAVSRLPQADMILRELELRPKVVDLSNFKTACISVFGPTLYDHFIGNYTRRMWGLDPAELSAHWAPGRLELRDGEEDGLFKDEWQGLPEQGYSAWVGNMVKGLEVKTGRDRIEAGDFDVVVSTARIDETANVADKLEYRSLRFEYALDEAWGDASYGTINLPQHAKFIRKANFKVLYRRAEGANFIQYQEPCAVIGRQVPMYPVHTRKNEMLFTECLKRVASSMNICPAGRLGLFEYLDMDEAIEQAMALVAVIENYRGMAAGERVRVLMGLRKAGSHEGD